MAAARPLPVRPPSLLTSVRSAALRFKVAPVLLGNGKVTRRRRARPADYTMRPASALRTGSPATGSMHASVSFLTLLTARLTA
jgi:hypothetical protein